MAAFKVVTIICVLGVIASFYFWRELGEASGQLCLVSSCAAVISADVVWLGKR